MKIVAIGGGEIGRLGHKIETGEIDKEIIRLSGRKHPKVLFLPTASEDSEVYCEAFHKYYGQNLGCRVDLLRLLNASHSYEDLKQKILGTDIIYVGGGNTQKMLEIWHKFGIDTLLIDAGKKGIVLTGLSAGAYCWFEKSISSSREVVREGLCLIKGLGNVCHYNLKGKDKKLIWKNVSKVNLPVIALENCSAFEVINSKYRVLVSSKDSNAYRLYYRNGKVVEEELYRDKKFRHLKELFINIT